MLDPEATMPPSANGITSTEVSASSPAAIQPLPSTIGRYRILRLLGEGGMGAVYEAEQNYPQRRIALKVIRAGFAGPEMLRRFQNETQALGRLQHAGIAQIYDAGTAETPFGLQPYIAMELIRGQTLLGYCDEHKLNARQRLEIVARICDAVQHAHQRGLIHRDLKPANILVDEEGLPRILDFGVAKLTDSDTQATRQTDMGQLIGTLAYMSPEQVSGDTDEIDTRSDVYAIGIILYELLAGRFPYVIGRQLHEAVRVIREDEPAQLSSIARNYRGDIETIVAKSLEKDKTRRYASAAELAADIRRYLHDEPIIARPPSATYQLQKFARRNKPLVIAAAAVFLVLIIGVVASTWEAIQARRAEKKARQQTAIAQAVDDFLQKDLLGQADVTKQSKPDANISVRTVLDRAAQNIQGKFPNQPEVEVAIRDTIGDAYDGLGLGADAEKQLATSLALSRRALGEDNPKTLAIKKDLGSAVSSDGRYPEAETILTQTLDEDRTALGEENRQTLEVMSSLGNTLAKEAKYAASERLLKHAEDISRRILGPEDELTLDELSSLTYILQAERKWSESEPLAEQLVALQTRVHGPYSVRTLRYKSSLALTYVNMRKRDKAEPLLRELIKDEQRVLGPEHPDTLSNMCRLALVLFQGGKFYEAVQLETQVVDIERRTRGPEHPDTLVNLAVLVEFDYAQNKHVEAAALARQLVASRERVLGPNHSATLESVDVLAWTLIADPDPRNRHPQEALQLARRAVKGDPSNGDVYNTLALAEYRNGHWNESIAAARRGVELNHGKFATDFFFLAMAEWQKGERAEAIRTYQRGVDIPGNQAVYPEWTALWTEAAKLLHQPGPPA